MKRFLSVLSGLAIAASASTAQAQVDWAMGAPGGTSGGAIRLGADRPSTDGATDPQHALATGISAAQVMPTTGADYTISAWIKSEEANPADETLANDNRWWFGTGNRGAHFGIQNGTNDDAAEPTTSGLTTGHWSNDSTGSTSVQVNEWVHVTHVYRNGVQEIYIDGDLDGTTVNGAPNFDNTDLQIGSRDGSNGPGWNGCIDDVAIFTSALSAGDIADLADDSSLAVSLGAAAYYNFEDNQSGSTAENLVDVATSGLTGTPDPDTGVGAPALQRLTGIGNALAALPPLASWTMGAPGGTSGGALALDGGPGNFLDTGITSELIGSNRGADGLSLGTDYTVSAWILSTEEGEDEIATDDRWWFGTQNQGIHLGILEGGRLRHGHWNSDTTAESVVPSETWVHATYVFDADGGTLGTGQVTMYLDGVEDATLDTLAPNRSSTNLVIGAQSGGRRRWNGSIDDVAIFNIALSDAQVGMLHDDTTQAVALGAVAYYNFEDSQSGTTAANLVTGSGLTDSNGDPSPQQLDRIAANVEDCLRGDVNRDGLVNFLDISPFIRLLSSGGNQCEGDVNEDEEVNFLDISPFIRVLSGQ